MPRLHRPCLQGPARPSPEGAPAYPYPGKRPILSGSFYRALHRDNVELVPHAVASVTAHGVVDALGMEHHADVLVMATGFQPTNYLATFDIVGRHGVSLHEWWHGEPAAFLGITVPGFPNFYMLYGPNTNGGEIVLHLERSMAKTAWVVSNNYYKTPSGRVVTQWPYGMLLYGALTKLLGRISETTRTITCLSGR